MAGTRWQPAKPRTRIKVIECGPSHWDEQDHGLDIPHGIDTIDFKVTGTGHERIEGIFKDCCADRRHRDTLNDKQPEQRIAAWLSRHACSFVLFDTKARATVIGFEREEDADGFRRQFVLLVERSRRPSRFGGDEEAQPSDGSL